MMFSWFSFWHQNHLTKDRRADFAAHRSGNGRGLPSGAEKRLTERYRVGDARTRLFVDYVLDDPEYLVEPLEDTFGWTYSPHMDLIPFSCDVDVARRYMEE